MECAIAADNTSDEQIRQILAAAKTVAIVGLSPDETKDSNRVARYLQQVGYEIIPIYPKEDKILGQKVYRALNEIEQKIDIVDVFRKPAVALELAKEILERKDAPVLWTQLGIVNNEAAELLKAAGRVMIQNKCTKLEHERLFK
ncbi:MAG: CoA-binding protein [Helicobacteraceae bacterium]